MLIPPKYLKLMTFLLLKAVNQSEALKKKFAKSATFGVKDILLPLVHFYTNCKAKMHSKLLFDLILLQSNTELLLFVEYIKFLWLEFHRTNDNIFLPL